MKCDARLAALLQEGEFDGMLQTPGNVLDAISLYVSHYGFYQLCVEVHQKYLNSDTCHVVPGNYPRRCESWKRKNICSEKIRQIRFETGI